MFLHTDQAALTYFWAFQISKATDRKHFQIRHKEGLRTGMCSPLVLMNASLLKTQSLQKHWIPVNPYCVYAINLFSWLSYRELLLNNNCLRVLPYELGRLFRLQTLGLKGTSLSVSFRNSSEQWSLFVAFTLSFMWCVKFTGNPLSQDILNLYQEPDGTRKLLNYMLDNLAGGVSVQILCIVQVLSLFSVYSGIFKHVK